MNKLDQLINDMRAALEFYQETNDMHTKQLWGQKFIQLQIEFDIELLKLEKGEHGK